MRRSAILPHRLRAELPHEGAWGFCRRKRDKRIGGMYVFEESFRKRLIELRMGKDVSARDMSLSMGQSEGYINKIESGHSLPSLTGFFYICEFFGISPRDFFDEEIENPALLQQAMDGLKALKDNDLALILGNINRLREK